MSCDDNFNFDNSEEGSCSGVDVGNHWLINGRYTDEDLTPLPITSGTMQMVIEDGSGGVLLTLNEVVDRTITGIYINDGAVGDFDLQISGTDSTTIGEGAFPYKITYTDNTIVNRLSYGNICFLKEDI